MMRTTNLEEVVVWRITLFIHYRRGAAGGVSHISLRLYIIAVVVISK
jgi:hypothetical protein